MSDEQTLTDEEAAEVIATVPKEETATLIIPLYGFFNDGTMPLLTPEMLQMTLYRARSLFHPVYLIFVGEKGRVDPKVLQLIAGKAVGGNVRGVEVEQFATYGMYVNEGLRFALENTQSKFLIVVNPWIMLGKETIDVLIERLNKNDVSVVSGADTRLDGVTPETFDEFVYKPIREFRNMQVNLFGIKRSVAESVTADVNFRTRAFLGRDFWQSLQIKGNNVIVSQSVPFYSLDLDWSTLEDEKDMEADRQRFLEKWKFNPTEVK